MRGTFSARAVVAALAFLQRGDAALYNQVVETKYGSVVGQPAFNSTPTGYNWTNWQDITVFKGIPFAASTAGSNRWRAPQKANPWNSTLDAKDFGPVCPGSTIGSHYTVSEDCLSLNIWSPAKAGGDKLPVVMWSYPAGSASPDDLFNGGGMAHKGVVFVNYNYRTASFGWMSHPELSEEFEQATGHNSSGNWGMLDQFAALHWLRENIEAFGGDPDRITVQGQSAGSAATYHILNSPLTTGQIAGAIIESGVRDPHDPLATSLAENYITLETSLEQGVKFLDSLNISSIAEARKLPYSDLETSMNFFGSQSSWSWTATLDGYAMPATYLETLLKGAANQVPVITGNTQDESGATYGLNISVSTYESDIADTYNSTWVDKFLDAYLANTTEVASAAYNAQFSDRSKVGTWLWTQLWKTSSEQPVWNYFWNHAPPGQNQGAYHESEINYVLNNLYKTGKPWKAEDFAIAEQMNDYWVNFIKTQDPNGRAIVEWPAATKVDSPMVQVVGDSFCQEPVTSPKKVQLFVDWFATLQAY